MAPRTILCALGALFTIPSAFAHMQMLIPSPLRDPHSDRDDEPKDWNILTPLHSDGSDFACKGYQWNTPWTPVARYEVGGTYQMTLKGGATHGGGSCQISLSCDGGSEFKAIKSIVGGCPIKKKYDFTIPRELDSALGKERKATCLLGWTWFNRIGNREMYMNCAVVDIVPHGSLEKDKSKKKNKPSKFDKRDTAMVNAAAQTALSGYPDLFVANLAKINDCATKETFEVIFNDPGVDVVYGDDENKSSSKTTFKGRACTGRSRKSAGSSTSTAQSSPKQHSQSSSDNGQWQGGNDNQEEEASSDSSVSSKISDGQWHPELWGSPSSKSEEKDDRSDQDQEQEQKLNHKLNEEQKDNNSKEADDANFELVDVKHPDKKLDTAVGKELDAYLSNLYEGRQRERKSCEQLPIESDTELIQRDEQLKRSDSKAMNAREIQDENNINLPRASRRERWATYKRSLTTHSSNNGRSLDLPFDAIAPIPGTLKSLNAAADDKFLAFIDRLNHAGGNLFTLVKFASSYLDHAPPADIGLVPSVDLTDNAVLAYNKGLLEAQEAQDARNKIEKISKVVLKTPSTGMTAEIANQIVNQLSVPAALPVALVPAVAPVKAPELIPGILPVAEKVPTADFLAEVPKKLPLGKAPVLLPKVKPEGPADILTELLKRDTMDTANHEAEDQFDDLLARLENLEDEVDDLLDYVGAGENDKRSLQDQDDLSSPQTTENIAKPAAGISTTTKALDRLSQQMDRLIAIADIIAGAVAKFDPSVKRSTTNYIESTVKDSELKIWHRIVQSLRPANQKRQLLVPGLFPAQLQNDKVLQVALCTLKHFGNQLGVTLPDINDLFDYQEPRAHWSGKISGRDSSSSAEISCAKVLQKRQSGPFVDSSDEQGEGGPSEGAAEELFPAGEPDALMEGVETPETEPGFDWSELFPHLQGSEAEEEDPRPLREPSDEDRPLPRPIAGGPAIQSLPPPDGPILPPLDTIDSDEGPISNLGPIGTPEEDTEPRVLLDPPQWNSSSPTFQNTTAVNVLGVENSTELEAASIPLAEAPVEQPLPVVPMPPNGEGPVVALTAPPVTEPVPVNPAAPGVEGLAPVVPPTDTEVVVPEIVQPVPDMVESDVRIDGAPAPPVGPPVGPPVEAVPAEVIPPAVVPVEAVQPEVVPLVAPAPEGVPAVAPEASQEEAPAEAPEVAPAVAPGIAPAVAPEIVPAVAPEAILVEASVAPEAIQEEAPEVAPADAPAVAPAVAPEFAPEVAPAAAPEGPAVAPEPSAPLPAGASTGKSLGDLMKEAFPELAAEQEQHKEPGEWTDGAIHRPASLPVRSIEKPFKSPPVDPAEDVAAILPFFMGPGPVVPPGMTIKWPTPTGPVDNLEKMPPLINDLSPTADDEIRKFFADLKKDAADSSSKSKSTADTISTRQTSEADGIMHTTETELQSRCHLKKLSVKSRIESWEREVSAQCARTRAGLSRLPAEAREAALQACLDRQVALKRRVGRLIGDFSVTCGMWL